MDILCKLNFFVSASHGKSNQGYAIIITFVSMREPVAHAGKDNTKPSGSLQSDDLQQQARIRWSELESQADMFLLDAMLPIVPNPLMSPPPRRPL